jgi:Kef-type K+ transport system membrane component KefB
MKILGYTLVIVIALFILTVIATAMLGSSDEASWALSWLFLLLASGVLLVGLTMAIARLVDRLTRRGKDEKAK